MHVLADVCNGALFTTSVELLDTAISVAAMFDVLNDQSSDVGIEMLL